jgi:hypothetical protein
MAFISRYELSRQVTISTPGHVRIRLLINFTPVEVRALPPLPR